MNACVVLPLLVGLFAACAGDPTGDPTNDGNGATLASNPLEAIGGGSRSDMLLEAFNRAKGYTTMVSSIFRLLFSPYIASHLQRVLNHALRGYAKTSPGGLLVQLFMLQLSLTPESTSYPLVFLRSVEQTPFGVFYDVNVKAFLHEFQLEAMMQFGLLPLVGLRIQNVKVTANVRIFLPSDPESTTHPFAFEVIEIPDLEIDLNLISTGLVEPLIQGLDFVLRPQIITMIKKSVENPAPQGRFMRTLSSILALIKRTFRTALRTIQITSAAIASPRPEPVVPLSSSYDELFEMCSVTFRQADAPTRGRIASIYRDFKAVRPRFVSKPMKAHDVVGWVESVDDSLCDLTVKDLAMVEQNWDSYVENMLTTFGVNRATITSIMSSTATLSALATYKTKVIVDNILPLIDVSMDSFDTSQRGTSTFELSAAINLVPFLAKYDPAFEVISDLNLIGLVVEQLPSFLRPIHSVASNVGAGVSGFAAGVGSAAIGAYGLVWGESKRSDMPINNVLVDAPEYIPDGQADASELPTIEGADEIESLASSETDPSSFEGGHRVEVRHASLSIPKMLVTFSISNMDSSIIIDVPQLVRLQNVKSNSILLNKIAAVTDFVQPMLARLVQYLFKHRLPIKIKLSEYVPDIDRTMKQLADRFWIDRMVRLEQSKWNQQNDAKMKHEKLNKKYPSLVSTVVGGFWTLYAMAKDLWSHISLQ